MKTRRLLSGLVLVVVIAGVPAAAEDAPFYVRKATWHESMRASRDAFEAYKSDALSRLAVRAGPWFSIGPFRSEAPFATAFAPEKEVALKKTYEHGQLRWVERPEWEDGSIIQLEPVQRSAQYMYRIVQSERETSLTAYLGSDDGVKLWVNGSLILRHDVDRPCERNQEVVTLSLHRGENKVLMKVNNGGGPTAFYFSFLNLDPGTLWDSVRRDFPTPEARREMMRERDDRIWSDGWKAGNLEWLAGRYWAARNRLALGAGLDTLRRKGVITNEAELMNVREEYLEMHGAVEQARLKEMKELTLTPRPSPRPRINGAKVFGVRPGAPVLYTIPATGKRPMTFAALNLPEGLQVDNSTGQITGSITEKGEYRVTLRAKNEIGTAERVFRIVVGEKIALTPPLGWNSWNCFATDVDEAKIRAAADAMVSSGLTEHGWAYINIDDCWMVHPETTEPLWQGEPRDRKGMINSNKKFPDMKGLSAYVHGKGLKLGIYSSPGPLTCAGFTASYGHEENDARRFAEWGVDYLKYDWCSYGRIAKDQSVPELRKPYEVMRAALRNVNRDVVYSLCQYGMGDVWEWGAEVGGNCWRTTGDIVDTWESMSGIGFGQAGHEKYAGPGHWNDPDMLVVGWVGWGPELHPTRLTPHEQMTHITLWSLLAAPLLIGCDMTKLDEFTLSLLTNDEVLEVNQDPLGKQAARIAKRGALEVWAKGLEDGSKAVGLFNRGNISARVTALWSDLGVTGRHAVRDLWRQKDIGTFEGKFGATIARHGAMLLRISKER